MRAIESLYIYPVKSCRGQSVKQMNILRDGPQGDRLWMLVDENGKFLSQREHPQMATLETHLDESGLTLGYGKQFFRISLNNSLKRTLPVTIWNDTVEAALEPDLYSQAISQHLGVTCRLVRYTPNSQRKVKSVSEAWSPEVRFADGRPLLIINSKSLEDLNSKMTTPVGVERFRCNVFFSGEQAFEEDAWSKIRIGEVVFSQPKKCARCVMINIDQQEGVGKGPDPLKTLASYRRVDKGVNFGVLWIPENEGRLSLSDKIEVLA